jgi:hypothetical protein
VLWEGSGQLSRYSNWLWAGRSWDQISLLWASEQEGRLEWVTLPNGKWKAVKWVNAECWLFWGRCSKCTENVPIKPWANEGTWSCVHSTQPVRRFRPDIHEWLHDTLPIAEREVSMIQIDGPKRQVYIHGGHKKRSYTPAWHGWTKGIKAQ